MNLPVVNVGMIGHVDHGKCVSLNDFILLNNNVLTGGDLVKLAEEKGVLVKEENEGKFYDVGLHAYCLNDKLDFVKSKAFVYIQPYSGEMIAVRTASGRELTTTPNHPFLINRGGKLGWVQANKLVTSDYISVLKKADFSGEMEFGDYVDDLSREYVVIDSRKFEDLREKTKSFTEFDRCTDEEVNELRVLYKLSGAKLAREVGVTRQYLTNSFNVEGLSKPLREKILGVFFVLPKPKLESNELITCSKKDSGNVLSFRDAPLSPDLMKWIAFVCAEGGKGKERLRVTQKTYLNLMKDFFDISLREFGIKFRKISGIDYEFCGRAFIRYLDKKFDVVPGTSRKSPIPSWLLSVGRGLQRDFLRWFVALEGEFRKDSIVVTQASRKSIQVLALLLMNNGIRPMLSRRKKCAANGRGIKREYYQLRISGRGNLGEVLRKIGVEDEEKRRKIITYLAGMRTKSKVSNFVVPIDYSRLRDLLIELGMRIDKIGGGDKQDCRKKLISTRKWYFSLRDCRTKNTMAEGMFEKMLADLEARVLCLENLLKTDNLELIKREFGISNGMLAKKLGIGKTTLYQRREQNASEVLLKLKELCANRIVCAREEIKSLKTISPEYIFYDRIVRIEKIPYDGLVVDLANPDYKNFISGFGGVVSHNTTLTEALSGVWTDRHSEELRRGVSIRLGYADTIFRKCSKCDTYTTEEKCPKCGEKAEPLRRISFVDAPGHETLMATMLSGAAIMDGAVLVIAANEPCPQPQTKEHLMGLDIIGVHRVVVAQNKIELVPREEVIENYRQIKKFLEGTRAEGAPIVPISAVHGVNTDRLIQAVEEHILTPQHDLSKPYQMRVARSFDVNRPGTSPEKLTGGVIGGALLQGKLKVGEEIEIRPGFRVSKEGKMTWQPLTSEIVSLRAGGRSVKEAEPGGLLGIGTKLDPSLTKADSLVGSVAGKPGTLPPLLESLSLEVHLLERVVGTAKELEVKPLTTRESLMINVGTATTVGTITSARGSEADLKLKLPICAEEGTRAAISRQIEGRWRLIGYGIIS